MSVKLVMNVLQGGARLFLPAMTRRAAMKASVDFVAVPFALNAVVSAVSAGKISEENQDYIVLAASILSAYGPARAASKVRNVFADPRSSTQFMKSSVFALTTKATRSVASAAAMMAKVNIEVVKSADIFGRSLVITLPKYGSMTFAASKSGLSVSGSSAFMTSVIAAGGFIASSESLTIDDIIQSSMQVAVALVREAQALEDEQISEVLLEADPISLLSRLGVIGESMAMEHPLTTRREIAALAISSISGDAVIENGISFDSFVDVDGDEILVIDGTAFLLKLPIVGSDEADIVAVAPSRADADKSVSPTGLAIADAIQDLLSEYAKTGKIPFAIGDGAFAIGLPHPFTMDGRGFVVAMTISETGLIGFRLFEGDWFESASEQYDSDATRNWAERALDFTSETTDALFKGSEEMAGKAWAGITKVFTDSSTQTPVADKATQVEVVKRDTRLDAKPGEVVVYSFNELENSL